MARYIATINLVVEADSVAQAEDGIAETFRTLAHDTPYDPPFVVDWGYQNLPGWRRPDGTATLIGPHVTPLRLPEALQTVDLDEVDLQPHAAVDGLKLDAIATLARLVGALRDRQRLHGEDIGPVLEQVRQAETLLRTAREAASAGSPLAAVLPPG